jgi:23S rRNA (cytosine1962-C5)-methyltransferase
VLGTEPPADLDAELRARIASALERRRKLFDPALTTAFRWIHGEADRLPGVHVDLYADVAVVRHDGDGARAFYRDLPALLAEATPLREVKDRGTGARMHGAGAPSKFEVLENGLRFEVSPASGGKGGLFLDQRENRERVGLRAKGLTVLNLFGATGGFSLYAARGGARSTDTVDLARPALLAAKRNFERNGLPTASAAFHASDVFEFLEAAKGKRWGLVISDPPSFAPSRASLEKARGAYGRLHKLAARATAPGGLLCAASCSSHLDREDFLASVAAGARSAGRRFVLEGCYGAGADHPVLPGFPEGDYLKFAIGRVR